jgi:hypothetical protein
VRVFCDYCGNEACLTRGKDIYPNMPSVHRLSFWKCTPCQAWVGCHKRGAWTVQADGSRLVSDGTLPMGRLAKADLRDAKRRAHRAFDPLWQNAGLSRRVAYAWLAHQLRIPVVDCHIGEFDAARCEQVIKLCTHEHQIINSIFGKRPA